MWEKVEFSEIVKDITGGNKKLSKENYLPFGIYPIVDQGEKFIGGYYNTDITLKIKGPVIVFGDHSKCIKYIDFDFIFGADGIKVLEPKPNLNTKFLFHFLQTVHLPDVGYSRHYKFLKESRIPLPPLPIQEKIAAILDKADELRRKDQELQDKYDELAQAIFIDMFGDPVRNEKGWEKKKLAALCDKILGGGTPKKSNSSFYTDGNVPWVTPKDMKKEFIESSVDKITFEAVEKSSTKLIPPYSLLMVNRSGILKRKLPVAINIKEVTVNQDMKAFIFKDHVNIYFMLYFFYATERFLLNKVRAVTADNIEFSEIINLPTIAPPLHLQEAFAKKIELINKLKAKANTERSEELFQSLLQRAFKGELVSKTQLTE